MSTRFLTCAALAVTVLTSACATLTERYDDSIFDSAIYQDDRRDAKLWPITATTVLASFSNCKGCPGSSCSSKCGDEPLKYDVWVSPAEQVLDFCRHFDDVVLRMQQLQGLAPNLDQDPATWKLLVVRAGPDDLFRPCADPDPTTEGPCPAVFPCFYPGDMTDCTPERKQEIAAHMSWMAQQAFSSWRVPDGFPWTRQGYTYNWNRKAASIVGTSEYVIPAGSEVQVCGLVSAVETCRRGALPDGICPD